MKFNFKKVVGIGLLSIGILYLANKMKTGGNHYKQENEPVLERQEVEVASQNKKEAKKSKKRMNIKIILLTILLFASGIIAQRLTIVAKEPINIESFIAVMQENGYELLNATENAIQGDVHTVLVANHANHQFELFEFINTSVAQQFFQGLVTTWEASPSLSAVPYSQNGINFNIFHLETNDYYFQILRVGNILILAQGNQSYQNDIREVFNLIGHAH